MAGGWQAAGASFELRRDGDHSLITRTRLFLVLTGATTIAIGCGLSFGPADFTSGTNNGEGGSQSPTDGSGTTDGPPGFVLPDGAVLLGFLYGCATDGALFFYPADQAGLCSGKLGAGLL